MANRLVERQNCMQPRCWLPDRALPWRRNAEPRGRTLVSLTHTRSSRLPNVVEAVAIVGVDIGQPHRVTRQDRSPWLSSPTGIIRLALADFLAILRRFFPFIKKGVRPGFEASAAVSSGQPLTARTGYRRSAMGALTSDNIRYLCVKKTGYRRLGFG